jgi:3-oxoacyl-(acyl-carrier-protein) synthase
VNRTRVFITGMGITSSLGEGLAANLGALKKNISGIRPLGLFRASEGNRFPAGEIAGFKPAGGLPRTHALALAAAREALAGGPAPDAVIIGTTTGGMPVTEELLRKGETSPEAYRLHSTSSVAELCARELGCAGPVMTVTTACSSGTAAIKLALELLRTGAARRVLAGGADALCRLTYYGFNSLQLIDPAGSRPLDRTRRGMSVAEGSGMLVLESAETPPAGAIAEVLGGGLSCDAYHPAAPHPEGAGARVAMARAIEDAGISLSGIEYINLHGTGTTDNDLAEGRAIRSLFGDAVPVLSSIKGATGHSLAAAGAIEAVVSCLCIRDGVIPANTGCVEPDPAIGITPLLAPLERRPATVLSNSFGFGGNNACLVLSDPGAARGAPARTHSSRFRALSSACITGAGDLDRTIAALNEGKDCRGTLPLADISGKLPPREVRRLKRLPRLAISLAMEAAALSGGASPSSIFFGTGWGPLSETHDFLTKLFESDEQFTSPTDFVGSVHNAPAGQAAIWLKAAGANLTVTGGDYSFEQALFAATLAAGDGEALIVMGADEHHDALSPLFDASVRSGGVPSDGGGALCLLKEAYSPGAAVSPLFYRGASASVILSLVEAIDGAGAMGQTYAAVFAGMPAGNRQECEKQLGEFIAATGFTGPVVDYRSLTGEFASASAAAAAIAVRLAAQGALPAPFAGGAACSLADRGILLLGLGDFITAVGITA